MNDTDDRDCGKIVSLDTAIVLTLCTILCIASIGLRTTTSSPCLVDTESNMGNSFGAWISTPSYYYLHNDPTPPTGDTISQSILPLSPPVPTLDVLYNYDLDRDGAIGLLIQRGGTGAGETDPNKTQAWRSSSLSDEFEINGAMTIDVWSAMKDFDTEKNGSISVFLLDYSGSGETLIGTGVLTEDRWQGGSGTFVKKSLVVSGVDYTIPQDHYLEVRLIVNSDADDDMWFAYDTISRASVVKIPG